MEPRTIGALALFPTGNHQGGVYFLSLLTGRVLNRTCATKLPMPNDVIDCVHHMARQQRANHGLIFGDRHQNTSVDNYWDDSDDDSDDESYHPEDDQHDDDDDDHFDDSGDDDQAPYNHPPVQQAGDIQHEDDDDQSWVPSDDHNNDDDVPLVADLDTKGSSSAGDKMGDEMEHDNEEDDWNDGENSGEEDQGVFPSIKIVQRHFTASQCSSCI